MLKSKFRFMLSPPSKSVVLSEFLFKFLEMCGDAKESCMVLNIYSFWIFMPDFYISSTQTLTTIIADALKFYKTTIV